MIKRGGCKNTAGFYFFSIQQMKNQTLDVAATCLEFILKLRIALTEHTRASLLKFVDQPPPPRGNLRDFIETICPKTHYNFKDKLRACFKAKNTAVRVHFRLLDRSTSQVIAFEQWNIEFSCFHKPEVLNNSQLLSKFKNVLISIYKQAINLPLWTLYLHSDEEKKFKKKNYFLDYKIQYEVQQSVFRNQRLEISEIRIGDLIINKSVSYNTPAIKNENYNTQNAVKKPMENRKQSKSHLTKRLSTQSSQKSFSDSFDRKLSFIETYDEQHDITFLSKESEADSLTRISDEGQGNGSSEFELITQERDQKLQFFRDQLMRLKLSLMNVSHEMDYFE